MKKFSIATLLLFLATGACCAADDAREPTRIAYREKITNFWGERKTTLHLVVAVEEQLTGEINWSLTAAGRTLIARTSEIQIEAGGEKEVEIAYTLPAVKDGVIYPIELRAWVTIVGKDPQAELNETFYLFGRDPFATDREWLKTLNLRLFDPEEKTAELLTELELPFERVTNLTTIDDFTGGMLIIGEGVDWDDYGELGRTLINASARGVEVFCLSGASAKLPLSDAQSVSETAQRLSFRRSDVLRDFDKRLSLHWASELPAVAQSLAIAAENDQVLLRAVDADEGWPWVELRFPQQAGRFSALTWCGFGLIRSWNDSPTPQYALHAWLRSNFDRQPAAPAP